MVNHQRTLKALAQKIRELYCEQRNLWHYQVQGRETNWGAVPMARYDGGVDEMGRNWGNVWDEIALFVCKRKVNYASFVRAQFSVVRKRPIDPFQLKSDKAYDLYLSTAQSSSSNLASLFALQREVFQRETSKLARRKVTHKWDDNQIFRAVLGNRLLRMSALFRYCLAVNLGYESIAETFHLQALEQYLVDAKIYDSVWGAWIPDALKREAASLDEFTWSEAEELPQMDRPTTHQRTIVID